jgi:putative transposase
MKRSRFTEEQIIAILREQEAGVPTAEVCRRHVVSSATFYKWKAKFGGLEVSEAKRLKALEDENGRLKRMLADAMLDNVALKDLLGKKMVTPAAHREAAAYLQSTYEMSDRTDRTSVRYEATREDDGVLRAPHGAGAGTSWVRLPPAARAASARGPCGQQETGPAAVSCGTADGTPAWRP